MSTRAPTARIICPLCPPRDGRPVAIALSGGEETVRCPQCASYFRVQTATVAGHPAQQVLGDRLSDYRLTLRAEMGAPSEHAFMGPMGMRIADGDQVSIVWQGRRLLGVANQTTSLWYPIPAQGAPHAPLRLNGWLGGAAALIVAGAILVTYHDALLSAAGAGGILSAVLILIAAALMLAPWVDDTLARHGGE